MNNTNTNIPTSAANFNPLECFQTVKRDINNYKSKIIALTCQTRKPKQKNNARGI